MIYFCVDNDPNDVILQILDNLCSAVQMPYKIINLMTTPTFELSDNPKDTFLFCGADLFEQCKKLMPIPQEKSLKKCLGFIHWVNGTRVTFWFGLNYLFIDPNSLIDLQQIIQVSANELTPLDDQKINIKHVQDERNFKNLIHTLKTLHDSIPVAIDLETSGLSSHDNTILCIAIAVSYEETYIISGDALDDHRQSIIDILKMPKVRWVAHNGKFDAGFLYQKYGVNITLKEDTMLLHYILDERQGVHGLKPLCRRLLALPDYDSDIKIYLPNQNSSYALIPDDVLHRYASYDVSFTLQLLDALDAIMFRHDDQDQLEEAYAFLMDCSNVFVEIEQAGMLFDLTAAKDLEEQYQKKIDEITARIQKRLGETFNPRSTKQIAVYLYDVLGLDDPYQELQTKARCTAKPTLSFLLEQNPQLHILADILELRKVSKICSTYITSLIKEVNTDGRLRTQLKLHGTVTGRLSSSKPNFQNFPRPARNEYAKPIRNLIIAGAGYTLIGADYSQAEVRLAANLSREPFYRNVYSQGLDVHTETARLLFQLTDIPGEGDEGYEEFTEQRNMAKSLNFGLIYGQGAAAIANMYNMDIDAAQAMYDKFYGTIPKLALWLEETRNYALTQGHCKSITGRLRRFGFNYSPDLASYIGFGESNSWKIRNQAGNFGIQSGASDITLLAALDMHRWLMDQQYGNVLVLVHDAIYCQVRTEYTQESMEHLTLCMEEAPYQVLEAEPDGSLYVPFKVDVHHSDKWGNL